MNSFIKFSFNCMPARSSPLILSLNNESNSLFKNVLIIGLCNSSANFSFCLMSDLKPQSLANLSASEVEFL